MPIVGLTDQTPALREIGRIRKGDEKKGDYRPGKNLNYFRVTFQHDSKKTNLMRKTMFEGHYGDQPTEINVQLAYDTYDANWFAWYTCYLKGGMIGMADGERWFYLRDYRTHETAISNYSLTEYGKAKGFEVAFDKAQPVYFYTSERQGEDIPVYATPEGRLSLVMPDLFGRFNMFLALTNSVHDIRQLSGELKSISQRAETFGIPMSDIPLEYSRRPEKISKPVNDGRIQAVEWLCHITPATEWDMLASKLLERKMIYAMLPKVRGDDGGGGIAALAEPIEAEIQERIMELPDDSVPPVEHYANTVRPFSAEQVKIYLIERNEFHANQKYIDPKGTRKGAMVGTLNEIFGGDINRHACIRWLTNVDSTGDWRDSGWLAFKDWLSMRRINDVWSTGEFVQQEAQNILRAVMQSQGQMEMDNV